MNINSDFLHDKAKRTLSDAQINAAKFISTTQDFKAKTITSLDEKEKELSQFASKTSKSVANSTLQTAQEVERIARNLEFKSLSTNLQRKFARAGVRKGVKVRNTTEASKVFETIPAQVRAQGEAAVRKFCQEKDWSHIVPHSKGGGNEASNGIFEHFKLNRDRGAKTMTPKELSVARSVLRQAAFRATVVQIASAMAKGAVVAAVVELVFAILENSLLYAEGQITQSELIEGIRKQTLEAGIAGAVVTALLVTIGLVFPPIAILLGTVAVPLAVAGIGSMSVRAWGIVRQANKVFGFTKQAQMLLPGTDFKV